MPDSEEVKIIAQNVELLRSPEDHLTVMWSSYREVLPGVKNLSDDDLLELYDHCLATMRAMMKEAEYRALRDARFPAEISIRMQAVDRGYILRLPKEPSDDFKIPKFDETDLDDLLTELEL